MPSPAVFLTPVLALVVWTLVMWVWMYATRVPALKQAGVDPQELAHPGEGQTRIPSQVRRVADNYNHLHEQPTIFYALMFFAAMTRRRRRTLSQARLGVRRLCGSCTRSSRRRSTR